MALCSIVNDDGIGFPSQHRIAEDSELSIRTVKRAMDDLEKAGTISRERRYREGGYRTSDLIQVHQEPKILGAKLSRDTESGDTVSNLRCHSGIAEPVNEPVSIIRKEKALRDFPENFSLDMATQKVADSMDLTDNEIFNEIDAMRDWAVNAGTKGRKKDWQAFARNWFRKNGKKGRPRGKDTGNTIKAGFDLIDKALAQHRQREPGIRNRDSQTDIQGLPGIFKITS